MTTATAQNYNSNNNQNYNNNHKLLHPWVRLIAGRSRMIKHWFQHAHYACKRLRSDMALPRAPGINDSWFP